MYIYQNQEMNFTDSLDVILSIISLRCSATNSGQDYHLRNPDFKSDSRIHQLAEEAIVPIKQDRIPCTTQSSLSSLLVISLLNW